MGGRGSAGHPAPDAQQPGRHPAADTAGNPPPPQPACSGSGPAEAAEEDRGITPPKRPGDLEVRLRNAYAALAAEPGAWVALARLRSLFGDVPKADVDEALRRLSRAPGVNLVPENNQKILTAADWDAALYVGGQHKHLLAIGV